MMMCRIGHGNLVTVARDNTFIVLRPQHGQPEISKELGVHLWHALASERGIQKAISTLAQGGLEEMPEFAIVHGLKNALHVIVRGNFSVLLLNHDGRYSSVDSEGAATWREYAELPAAEFCIRGVPGLTVRGTEEFYLASGVSRVSVICSLGWDDPDQPMNAVEASETGAIAEVELTPDADAQALSEAVAARVGHTASGSTAASAMSAVSPGALTLPGGIPEISEDYESAPHELSASSPEISLFSQEVPSLQELLADEYKDEPVQDAPSEDIHEPEPHEPEHLEPVVPELAVHEPAPHEPNLQEQMSAYEAKTQILEPLSTHSPASAIAEPLAPLAPAIPGIPQSNIADAAARVLRPIDSGAATEVLPALDDNQSTVLTNDLVEYRAAMENNADLPLPNEPILADRPVGVPAIRLSNGVRIPLDRTVLIGRAPEAGRLSMRDLPRLVNVASPNNDVSRTHAQVRIEGDFVLVTDLNSTNGVLLVEPGSTPRRLHPDEPTQIFPGVIVDLGDGVTFELEEPR